MKRKARKASRLTQVYNKDHSITLYCRGRKVFRTASIDPTESIKAFCDGWFNGEPHRFNKPQFKF